jgi:hypothetical protein
VTLSGDIWRVPRPSGTFGLPTLDEAARMGHDPPGMCPRFAGVPGYEAVRMGEHPSFPPETLVVNLFGGPGTGKSTNAALVFGKLKVSGVKAEIVHEFAKDLTWEDRHAALAFQPYIFGKQAYHVHRLLGQVDVIVTDSPILLSSHIYSRHNAGYDVPGLRVLARQTFEGWNTLNIFLRRDLDTHPFEEAGRNQDQAESTELDTKILDVLYDLEIPHKVVPILPGDATAEQIVDLVMERLP